MVIIIITIINQTFSKFSRNEQEAKNRRLIFLIKKEAEWLRNFQFSKISSKTCNRLTEIDWWTISYHQELILKISYRSSGKNRCRKSLSASQNLEIDRVNKITNIFATQHRNARQPTSLNPTTIFPKLKTLAWLVASFLMTFPIELLFLFSRS